ncbi:dipeptide epimerase [Candidatus Sumerlaeota bacterium]|nr:dipeptide epimerase [Candidatus Sumerlaeota bacterium]
MQSIQKIYMLKLRYPFGISRDTVTEIPTVLFRLGNHGQGEGSPVRYKKQKAEDIVTVLEDLARDVTEDNISDIPFHEKRARAKYPQHSAALCAFNIALWDAWGRREKKQLYELVNLPKPSIKSTYTVSLADNNIMEERAREVAHLPLLKIKLGRTHELDIDIMRRIRAVAPNAVLRVDANAGWTYDIAKKIIPELADIGVEFIEQPLAIGNIVETKKLHETMPLPIVVDEDVQDLASLDAVRGCVAGINIKLMKTGGLCEALRILKYARKEGWKVMVGCMVETRLALGAASHLAGAVDAMDVDGHMLTANDPFPPGSLREFSAELPLGNGPGVGLPLIDF